MDNQYYTVSITVHAAADVAFKGINSVTKWWTEHVEGSSEKLHDEFTVRFDDVHVSKQKLIEVIPGKKVVWLVTDSNLNFVEDRQAWTNTKIIFEIDENLGETKIRFTHVGLSREVECFDACSNAWSQYIKGSLFSLLTKGKGMPESR
jgi:hypothetical protein